MMEHVSAAAPAGAAGEAPLRIGYVLKRYPRYSETFVVNEILAHEEAGAEISIFSLYPTNDSHFQELISRVRAPVTFLSADGLRAQELWEALGEARATIPGLLERLPATAELDARGLYWSARLAAEARRLGLDLLHAHFATAATSVARHAAALAGLPYTFTAHAKDLFHDDVSHADLAAKLADAAGVVTVSDYNVGWLAERFPDSAPRVTRIYNGLPLDEFAFRSAGDAPPRPPLVVSVGRLVEKKGFDRLIDACARLIRDGVELDCRIVGTGELEPALAAQIRELGLEGRVRLLGARPRAEVAELVAGAALFAGSYAVGADGNRDGLPTVLVEAMALGTPCVAAAVTGVPEAVIDGETGLLVPPGDVGALAAAIRRLLDDRKLGARLAVAARRLVEERFDLRRNTRAQRELFARAAAGSPTRSLRRGEVVRETARIA